MPANGSASSRSGGAGSGGPAAIRPLPSPSVGAGPSRHTGCPFTRYGERGCRKPSGFSTNTPRDARCSFPRTVSPLYTCVAGMRSSAARSRMSATVCCDVQARTIAFHSSTRAMRSASRGSPESSSRSGRSIISRKLSNIAPVLVLNPTHPSAAGSIDGVSKLRATEPSSGVPTEQRVHHVAERGARDRHDLEHRAVDVHTDAVPARADHARERSRRHVAPGRPLADPTPGLERRPTRRPPRQGRSRLGLDRELGPGTTRHRSGPAVGRHRHDHEVLVRGP